ncbi:GP158 protein, partial [Pycnonotus jocosus]|nr:GP158 protein [Pycnonotus jocosus]
CRPCRPGCGSCEDDTPCVAQQDAVLRAAVLSCQACCMLAIFLSMLVSYHFRRSKASCPPLCHPKPPRGPCPLPGCTLTVLSPQRIRTSGIVLLETILFGSLLLYFPVFILYFKPSIFRCIVLRWVRMLGFAIVYGTITLKLYRWLGLGARDPHRGKGLGLGTPTGGRVWGSGAPQPEGFGVSLGWAGSHWDGLGSHWDGFKGSLLLCPTAELLFLLWGSFLCYATRAVPSAFHEPRYMGIALHNELLLSAAFHLLRLWVPRQGCGVCRWVGAAVGPGTALLVP